MPDAILIKYDDKLKGPRPVFLEVVRLKPVLFGCQWEGGITVHILTCSAPSYANVRWTTEAFMFFGVFCPNGWITLFWGLIYSSMASTKSTREVQADERPHGCWQRDRSRNTAPTHTATGRCDMDTATVATVRTDAMAVTSTALTTGRGTGVSPPWGQRRPMSNKLKPILCPPWRRNAPTPSAEVNCNSF